MHVYTTDPSVEFCYFPCVGLHFRGRKMIVPVSFCHTKSYKNAVNCMMSTKCIYVNGIYHFLKVCSLDILPNGPRLLNAYNKVSKNKKWKTIRKKRNVYILPCHLYMSRSTKKQQNDIRAKRWTRSACASIQSDHSLRLSSLQCRGVLLLWDMVG